MKTEFGKKLLKVMDKKMKHDLKEMLRIAKILENAEAYDIDNSYHQSLLDQFAEIENSRSMAQKTVNLMIRIEGLLETK